MKDIRERFKAFAEDAEKICSHISVRDDENGPYIFALGLKETHTLQLRKVREQYVLELWHGKAAETEAIIEEPVFSEIEKAFEKARGGCPTMPFNKWRKTAPSLSRLRVLANCYMCMKMYMRGLFIISVLCMYACSLSNEKESENEDSIVIEHMDRMSDRDACESFKTIPGATEEDKMQDCSKIIND